MVTVTIRKDTWTSRPWCADLLLDGKVMKSWMHGFKTKGALIREIASVSPKAEIVRGEDN